MRQTEKRGIMLRNLTGREIVLLGEGAAVTIPPDREGPPWIMETPGRIQGIIKYDGVNIRIHTIVRSRIEGLPPRADGVLLIVDYLIAYQCPERPDLLVPFGGMRDGEGEVVGWATLGRIHTGRPAGRGSA